MVRTSFESSKHGRVEVEGRHVRAERDTGTPESFEIESATALGAEIDLSDADTERAIDALFEKRGELIATGARL